MVLHHKGENEWTQAHKYQIKGVEGKARHFQEKEQSSKEVWCLEKK
jgi:hypothetical protein